MDFVNATAQMRKGILQFCILALIAEEEVYPSDIIQKLKQSKLIVVEGTLYPLLARLKTEGLLSYRWIESTAGPPRKYYRLTKSGEAGLQQLRKTWQELELAVNSIIKESE
ncbi:MAG TPA: PadR family transcriptional regulator [Candidatus Methylacidiphilales bacterium]|jgi:PadR family transcriptional regulator PadR|nr:PadR family transcriptional regulator [Candidatus Methylacidiphilales bacterium]